MNFLPEAQKLGTIVTLKNFYLVKKNSVMITLQFCDSRVLKNNKKYQKSWWIIIIIN